MKKYKHSHYIFLGKGPKFKNGMELLCIDLWKPFQHSCIFLVKTCHLINPSDIVKQFTCIDFTLKRFNLIFA